MTSSQLLTDVRDEIFKQLGLPGKLQLSDFKRWNVVAHFVQAVADLCTLVGQKVSVY